MPKLLLKFNAAVIKEIAMEKESISIGRKPDNDIVIDNPAISGHHCKLTMEGGGYYVEDLESTNGTFVNEKRIKKSGLHHNDVVGVAKHAVVFLNEAEVAAEAANQRWHVGVELTVADAVEHPERSGDLMEPRHGLGVNDLDGVDGIGRFAVANDHGDVPFASQFGEQSCRVRSDA